jgi:hypothetical protein
VRLGAEPLEARGAFPHANLTGHHPTVPRASEQLRRSAILLIVLLVATVIVLAAIVGAIAWLLPHVVDLLSESDDG